MPNITTSGSDKLRMLLQWFADNKITYNDEAIQIVEQQNTASPLAASKGAASLSHGFGVVSLRKLVSEEPLVVIPKTAVISAATSALANIFIDADIGGNLALCITVMYEKSLGHESPWYGYLQSLPECADIPLLWDAQSRSWLKGTDVGEWIDRDQASLLEDFGVLQDLVAEYPMVFGGDCKWDCFESFLKVASLVSSRAFSVDVHRDNSMVPFADIFNHRTAKENVHIECEEMVCPVCGEAFGCEHMDALEALDNQEGASEDESESEGSDESGDDGESDEEYEEDADEDGSDSENEDEPGEELPQLVDQMGNPVASELQQDEDVEMESVDSEHSDSSDSDGGKEDELVDTLEMTVFRPCKANTEVFNTYGEHGSAYLLHRYGFCDTKNPFDSVVLSADSVMQAFTMSVSEQRAKDVSAVIRRFEDLFESRHRACGQDEDEEDEEEVHDHGHDEESDEDIEDAENEEQEELADDENAPQFSIDAPGHPDLNLAALLVLGLADEAVFAKASQSEQVFRHYFPVIRRFWSMFQDELDNDTPVPAAFRKANQDGAVKKSTVGMVSNVVYRLAEARLQLLVDDSVLGEKPTADCDSLMASRWESAKMLRSNERKTLSQCIKTYKKIAAKLS
ncbi:hypothetical protein IWW39_005999 [Coemansia spiralis]|uniref:SET domain-containing protein n=1 Tax=Coemansia spiralis TaxID=417178 RepID=A0A9W8GE60_9FUNG|nr:hypothetical protein IWW39_005999 [Coemansia spiralis]